MNTGILDTITGVFVNAIQAGAGTLATFSLPLLGVFAIIAFYLHVGPALAGGGAGMGDTLAGVLLMLLKIGVFYWLLQNFVAITTAAFQTFLQWGQVAGGGVSLGTFLTPSTVMDVGFRWVLPRVCLTFQPCQRERLVGMILAHAAVARNTRNAVDNPNQEYQNIARPRLKGVFFTHGDDHRI